MAKIRRRAPNRYTITVYLGRDENGKRLEINETFHGGRLEAKQRAAELEMGYKKRNGPKHQKITLGEYLNQWLKKIKNTVSNRTYETYGWHVNRITESDAGKLPMYNLKTIDLQDNMIFDGLSPRTVRGLFGTLKTALRQAVVWEILNRDITVGLKTPKVPRKEKKILMPDALKTLLDATKGYKYYLVVRLLAITGMRLGEVLGLEWQDVDFKKRTLTIKRAADCRNRILKETKNVSSERIMKLDNETINLLACRKKERKVIDLTDNLIFSHNGRVVREDAIRRTIKYALKKAGLSNHVTPHTFRHTAGSVLLDAGYSLPTVAEFLGHSSPATTAAVYSHAVKKNRNNVADVIELNMVEDKSEDMIPLTQ